MDGRSVTSAENGKKGGRPKLEATKLREALIRKAEAHAEELADSIIGKALGLEAHKNADVQAHREILDRGLGKPVQGMEFGGKDGAPLTVQIVQYGAVIEQSEDKPKDE